MTAPKGRGPATAALLAALAGLAGCGRATPPDLRSEMSEAVSRLGVRPIYPLQERRRPGTVVLIDASVAKPHSGLPPWQEGSIWLTNELEDAFEKARERINKPRYPQSPGTLSGALQPQSGRPFFRQVAPTGPEGSAPEGSLSLAAMPGYTLASVDQAALATFIPNLVASFFASIGLRSTSYLRVEAEAVEVAEVPLDEFRAIISVACNDASDQTQFGRQGSGGDGVVDAAFRQFEQWRGERVDTNAAARGWARRLPTDPVRPFIGVLRRVFYLRAVRFVVEDSRATAAFAQAARRLTFPTGSQPVGLPSVTVNTNAMPPGTQPPPVGVPSAAIAAQNAMIAGLQAQIDQLRTGLATGSDAQIAASFARATAVGVDLVQVFDRPLAFGYQAFFVDAQEPIETERFARRPSRAGMYGFTSVCSRI